MIKEFLIPTNFISSQLFDIYQKCIERLRSCLDPSLNAHQLIHFYADPGFHPSGIFSIFCLMADSKEPLENIFKIEHEWEKQWKINSWVDYPDQQTDDRLFLNSDKETKVEAFAYSVQPPPEDESELRATAISEVMTASQHLEMNPYWLSMCCQNFHGGWGWGWNVQIPKIPDFGLFFERIKNADAFDLPYFAVFIELTCMTSILPSTALETRHTQ